MKKPKRQQKQLQQQTEDADKTEPFAHRRTLNTNFLFWTVCEDKACARARAYAGAKPEVCFDRWWPAVPEKLKVQLRAYVVGVGVKGMNREDALAYADCEVARWKAGQEEEARELEELAAPAIVREQVKAPANPPASSGPRIRSL